MSKPILVGSDVWEKLDSYDKNLKSKFIRAFRFLSKDLGHPSLRVETVHEGGRSFWRARVDLKYRVHFEIREADFLILDIGPHRLQGIG